MSLSKIHDIDILHYHTSIHDTSRDMGLEEGPVSVLHAALDVVFP